MRDSQERGTATTSFKVSRVSFHKVVKTLESRKLCKGLWSSLSQRGFQKVTQQRDLLRVELLDFNTPPLGYKNMTGLENSFRAVKSWSAANTQTWVITVAMYSMSATSFFWWVKKYSTSVLKSWLCKRKKIQANFFKDSKNCWHGLLKTLGSTVNHVMSTLALHTFWNPDCPWQFSNTLP